MTGIVSQNVGRTSGLIKTVSAGGTWTLIKTLTSDGSDATMSFVNGSDDVTLDSTYPIYRFSFINMHPETDEVFFRFNGSADTGSNYNVTKTTTFFNAIHPESGSESSLGYAAGFDLAQSTAFQTIGAEIGNDNDQCLNGWLQLFNPSSTTFVKHFMGVEAHNQQNDYLYNGYIGGYFNTTSAVDAVQFKMSSGDIDAGDICLYGIN